MSEAVLALGASTECRSAKWLLRGLEHSSSGQQPVDVVGVLLFLCEKEAHFLAVFSCL